MWAMNQFFDAMDALHEAYAKLKWDERPKFNLVHGVSIRWKTNDDSCF
jgi:hypothetical protein